MNKELFLRLFGMTEEQVISEAAKTNLNYKELAAFDKGKDFIDKNDELESEESKKKVVLKLIAYWLIKRNGDK